MLSGFADAVEEEPDPMLLISMSSKIEDGTKDAARQNAAIRKNEHAISSFTIALAKEGKMRLVSKAKTREWLKGAAYLYLNIWLPSKISTGRALKKLTLSQLFLT